MPLSLKRNAESKTAYMSFQLLDSKNRFDDSNL